MRSRPRTA